MRQVNATDFKSHFGEFADLVHHEPIEVLRGSKPVGVFISPADFNRLQNLDDAYWVARAEAAEATGQWIGHEEALRLLTAGLTRTE